ncbi:hypothetical protein AU892_24990 [Salmonella enterica subsp. diarizonae]|nr:hypothetical protein [Salmonella enterica]ECI0840390.1 hypothetical protein [Salmonella enterica subsp. diarizonae]
MRCLVPPGDVNQLTISADYKTPTTNTRFFLTESRAHSRIHRTTKFVLKRTVSAREMPIPPTQHTAMSRSWSQPEAHYRIGFNDKPYEVRGCA